MLWRRLITVPGYIIAWSVWLGATPLWLPLAIAVDVVRSNRGVALRSATFASVYLTCEILGMVAAGALWAWTGVFRPDTVGGRLLARLEKRGLPARCLARRPEFLADRVGDEDSDRSPHLRSRHEVGRALRPSGVPVIEFRAPLVIGSGSLRWHPDAVRQEHFSSALASLQAETMLFTMCDKSPTSSRRPERNEVRVLIETRWTSLLPRVAERPSSVYLRRTTDARSGGEGAFLAH